MELLTKNPIFTYLREAREEIRKVSWPTANDLRFYVIAVLVVCTVVAAYFGLLDWIFTLGLEALITRAG